MCDRANLLNLTVLGDGDFSFSASVMKQQQNTTTAQRAISIVATSFDNFPTLCRKYGHETFFAVEMNEKVVDLLAHLPSITLEEVTTLHNSPIVHSSNNCNKYKSTEID